MNDLSGNRIGRWNVLKEAGRDRWRSPLWECKCDCGTTRLVKVESLLNGRSLSCGCLMREQTSKRAYKHGMARHPIYFHWRTMHRRCRDKSNMNYGGRGIFVCERWHDVRNFIDDMFPSFKEGLQLDRIDVDGNYEPENCRWVTPSQNCKNKRNKATKQSTVDHVRYNSRIDKWHVNFTFNTQQEAEQFALGVMNEDH